MLHENVGATIDFNLKAIALRAPAPDASLDNFGSIDGGAVVERLPKP